MTCNLNLISDIRASSALLSLVPRKLIYTDFSHSYPHQHKLMFSSLIYKDDTKLLKVIY